MKKIILFCLLFSINTLLADNIFQFKLEKYEKLEGTYSAEIADGTVHFAIIKNSESKNYLLTPFHVDKTHQVKRLDAFSSKEMFNIISYHLNSGVLSVVNYDADNKEIQFIDYNLTTGKHSSVSNELKKNPDNIFRLKDKTLLISFDDKKNIVNIQSVFNSMQVDKMQIAIPDGKVKLFRNLIDEVPEAINQNEFVEKGSISKRKGYLIGDKLVYTLEKDKEEIQVYQFDLNNTKDFAHSTISTGFAKETKDISNYFYDNRIVFLAVEKSDIKLKSFDVETNNVIKQISLLHDLQNLLPSSVVTDYIKTALKSAIKSTVAVNKTKNGKLAFHLDNVEHATYSYHYNWAHHWMIHQQMMMQQQQMRSINTGRGFGPSPNDDYNVMSFKEKKYPTIDFIVDLEFNAVPNGEETTVYPNIDKEKYRDRYKDNKSMKELTSGSTENEMRYISHDPKTRMVSIAFDNLQ